MENSQYISEKEKKSLCPSELIDNEMSFTNPFDIANEFNDLFVNVGASYYRPVPPFMSS